MPEIFPLQKIYLDHNATTPVLQEVLDVMHPLYKDFFGNPSSIHSEGRAARVRLDEAREHVAELIGSQPGEVVFTSGGSESNNFAILGVALASDIKNRHILTCEVEHAAILNPLKQMEKLGFNVDRLPVDNVGRIDPDIVKDAIIIFSLSFVISLLWKRFYFLFDPGLPSGLINRHCPFCQTRRCF